MFINIIIFINIMNLELKLNTESEKKLNIKKYFLAFGGPTQNYHEAVKRICSQAEKFDLFDKIIGLTEVDLQADVEFWSVHKDFVNSNPRGYGYWLWKPYIIKKTLNSMEDGDILLYADSGCELNPKGISKFNEYIELTKKKKIIGTKACSDDCTYTKKDLSIFLGMSENINLLKANHMQATCLLIEKNNLIVDFVNEWYNIGSTNYHFIDDSPSIEENFQGFREHRHDQSIFNLLVKKYNLINYDLDPSNWGHGKESKNNYLCKAMEYPIWACRNRTGSSIID